MRHCMVDAVAAVDEDAIEDLCRAIERYMMLALKLPSEDGSFCLCRDFQPAVFDL